jgi:hypothetical protein
MTLSDIESCPGCRAIFPCSDGPIHPYMESSPACWAAYGEVLAREYTDPSLLATHRLSVDTYAVQHPGGSSRQSIQSVGVHLIRLCLFLEHGLTPEQANETMLKAGKIKSAFSLLEPPVSLGAITVRDVLETNESVAHAAMVRRWAQSAWEAWAMHHEMVREWLVRSNNLFKPKPLCGSASFRR